MSLNCIDVPDVEMDPVEPSSAYIPQYVVIIAHRGRVEWLTSCVTRFFNVVSEDFTDETKILIEILGIDLQLPIHHLGMNQKLTSLVTLMKADKLVGCPYKTDDIGVLALMFVMAALGTDRYGIPCLLWPAKDFLPVGGPEKVAEAKFNRMYLLFEGMTLKGQKKVLGYELNIKYLPYRRAKVRAFLDKFVPWLKKQGCPPTPNFVGLQYLTKSLGPPGTIQR